MGDVGVDLGRALREQGVRGIHDRASGINDVVDQQTDVSFDLADNVHHFGFARALAKRLDCLLAIVDKRRDRPGESEVMNIIGDITGKDCLLIDDIVDSGGTLCNAADAMLAKGASSVTAYITHGVLSGGAVTRVTSSKLRELVITDSIQPTTAVLSAHNIRVVTTAPLIGEAISRTAQEESVSSLFD